MNMQTDESGGDDIINGYVLPPTHIVGETMNKFAHQLTSRVHDDHFYGATSFSSSPQISTFHGTDRFMEGIPLLNPSIGAFQPERYISIENQEKLTNPIPLGCPLENAKYGMNNCLDVSFETMLHNSYGSGVPFPPELIGRVVGRNSLPPPPQSHQREWSTSQDSSQLSNELSLSLVTSRPSVCSEMSSNGVTSYSLHDQHILPDHTSCSSNNLLSGSRFVEAMQEILAEIACYALENVGDIGVNASFASSSIEADHNNNNTLMFQKQEMNLEAKNTLMFQKQEMNLEAKKKQLLTLLQMVDDQYSQCIDEIHTVTSAFHAVTELEPSLHARFALPTISFMYKSLRERISNHIIAVGAHLKEGQTRENKSYEACYLQKQWALQQLSKRDHHQMWRPQRGLPETSVSVLRTWMFQNFLHPYPKDSEKHLLALRSGLTRNQVSNWFINARVRLWKPMIEEMCAEMNRRKAREEEEEEEEMEGNHRNQMRFETRRFTRD